LYSVLNIIARFSILLFLGVTFSRCSTRGCMDIDAQNYEPRAKKDCNCCFYAGKVLGLYEEGFGDRVKSGGASEFQFYCNNELVGSSNYISYSYGLPNNIEYNGFRVGSLDPVAIISTGAEKQKKVLLLCTDQNKNWLWQDSVLVVANKVTPFQMY
jgi:hypothetical protein